MELIVSTPGGEHEVPPEYQELVCLFDDGRLLMAKDKASNPYLMSYRARVSRAFMAKGVKIDLQLVELAVIKEAIDSQERASGAGQKTTIDTTQVQMQALQIFEDAVRAGASDIHIRVGKDFADIMFRVNNDLTHVQQMPSGMAKELCQSIYVSLTDVSDVTYKEKARQAARISDRRRLPKGLYGLRVATTPSVDGTLMVMRLLYDTDNSSDIMSLGYDASHVNQVTMMMSRPYGINFISGPTGSGKSKTLQRVLAAVYEECKGRKHIITVEDPPEYPILGAVQTPVIAESEDRRGEAFRDAIRACMRLDPDIIMIGEVRDIESAQLAVDAAMTGHQVWTTIHANNAMAIVDRLVEIGIPTSTLCDPSLVTGMIAQRLVKRLCPECKVPFLDAEAKGLIDMKLASRVHRACNEDVGGIYVSAPKEHNHCPKCKGSGIAGRTVIAEIIIPDSTLCQLLREGKKIEASRYWIDEQKGMNILSHCIQKVKAGHVDPHDAEDKVGPLTMNIMNDDDKISMLEIDENIGVINDLIIAAD